MNRLMIISCSNLKSDAPEALPAIDRYKGVAYNVRYANKQFQPVKHELAASHG